MKRVIFIILIAVLLFGLCSCGDSTKDIEAKWQLGSTITFGAYPQTKVGKDSTPIEWLVLSRDGDKALIISKFALDAAAYNTEFTDVTWETCSLRKWLNSDFYNMAFNKSEKKNIIISRVTADKNPYWSTNPGNDTTDNVFLLSIAEVNEYLKDNYSRMCVPTDYAVEKGADKDNDYGCGWWWLRSPGLGNSIASEVNIAGIVDGYGNIVDAVSGSVRPCLWVHLF